MPVAANTVEITTSAAPVCGAAGAQRVAVRDAAIETLRAGYDRFIVIGGQTQNNVGVVGYTPMTANSYGSATVIGNPGSAIAVGSSTTFYTGGQPILGGSHDQEILVKMFHEGDAGAANAISARQLLGAHWQEAEASGFAATCF